MLNLYTEDPVSKVWRRGSRGLAHLADVVEVSVRDFLLFRQLLHLVQQDVHLELGAQVLQTAIAKGFSASVRNKNRKFRSTNFNLITSTVFIMI